MNYRLCTLDVTPDNEINDAWKTGTVLELPETPTVSEVCTALKENERMAPDWNESTVRLEEDGDDYLVCHKDGRKSYLLRRED